MTPPLKSFEECMQEVSILLLLEIFPADNIHECSTLPIENGQRFEVEGRKKQFISKSHHSSLIMIHKELGFLMKSNERKDIFSPDA